VTELTTNAAGKKFRSDEAKPTEKKKKIGPWNKGLCGRKIKAGEESQKLPVVTKKGPKEKKR